MERLAETKLDLMRRIKMFFFSGGGLARNFAA